MNIEQLKVEAREKIAKHTDKLRGLRPHLDHNDLMLDLNEIVTSTYLQAERDTKERIETVPTPLFTFQEGNPLANVAQGQNSSIYADGYSAGAIEMKKRILQSLKQTN